MTFLVATSVRMLPLTAIQVYSRTFNDTPFDSIYAASDLVLKAKPILIANINVNVLTNDKHTASLGNPANASLFFNDDRKKKNLSCL